MSALRCLIVSGMLTMLSSRRVYDSGHFLASAPPYAMAVDHPKLMLCHDVGAAQRCQRMKGEGSMGRSVQMVPDRAEDALTKAGLP